ncbi:MAG: rhodanese-like domain-containing protein [Flavobacteriales bacterium]|nr:rhodanese-like domain-containing protein [Flavobacteriales bacterium]MCB9448296.1 rhodanese-like domain-containing protein [Flavobacteriales bacterium]
MGILNMLFGGGGASEKVQEMLANGAVVIDVRSVDEYRGGHVAGSRNIPLHTLEGHVEKIKKLNKPVVVCCASGMRSGQAASLLRRHGVECENGGGWHQVNAML